LIAGHAMNEGEVAASTFGSWASALTTAGAFAAFDDQSDSREVMGGIVAAGLIGYPAGMLYARSARYNVTAGDVWTLWPAGFLGANLVAIPLVDSDVDDNVASALVTAGFLAGLVAGDRLIVRRFDYQRGDGILLGVGTLSGALMGSGLYALVDREGRNDRLSSGLSAAGGILGLMVSHYYLSPVDDSDRIGEHIRFDPSGALMAAAGVPGTHPILRLTF
jgi:hypothetical protein